MSSSSKHRSGNDRARNDHAFGIPFTQGIPGFCRTMLAFIRVGAGIFRDGLRGSHAKRLRSAREIEAQCVQATIDTDGTSHNIGDAVSDETHWSCRMSRKERIPRSTPIPVFAVLGGLLLSSCGVNNIPTYDESAKAKWSDVQNQYQRRADLIPNLVETVKGYATQEREVLTQVT